MVARMRGFNLEGMFGPLAEARATSGRASANLAGSIASGLNSLGEGIEGQRKEKESKRRFGIEKGFEERRLALAEGQFDLERESRLEAAGATDGLLDKIEAMSQQFAVMGTLGVSPSEKQMTDFQAAVDAVGGEEPVAGALDLREKNGGALPTRDVEDLATLDLKMKHNQMKREAANGLVGLLGPFTKRKDKIGARATLQGAQLLNAQIALNAEADSLQRRYALAGKQQVKAEKDAEASALLEAKRAASHNYRVMAKNAGFKDSDILAMFTGWLNDPEAKVRDIETSITRERRVDQGDARIAGTEKQRGVTNAQGNERLEQGRARLDILREQLGLSRERVDLTRSAQAAQAGRYADAATAKAVDEVQQALGRWDAADSAVEREFGKDAISQEEKQKQYALNRGRRVADLKKVQAADLARAYHAVNMSSQQRAEIEEAYGGVPPAPSVAAPQAPSVPAAQAPAPQQAQQPQRDQWFRDPQTGRLKKR